MHEDVARRAQARDPALQAGVALHGMLDGAAGRGVELAIGVGNQCVV